ncbi:hypothetical protein [Streptomyces kanasensis]|uniref:hypothetical protein n=1 Tax=Streptomyces kanasensis TaxID=936756 RepID=UPI0036FABB7C
MPGVHRADAPQAPAATPTERTTVRTAAGEAVAPALTRAQVPERAKTWLTANNGRPVPYAQHTYGKAGHRQDCSGCASMALGTRWKQHSHGVGGTDGHHVHPPVHIIDCPVPTSPPPVRTGRPRSTAHRGRATRPEATMPSVPSRAEALALLLTTVTALLAVTAAAWWGIDPSAGPARPRPVDRVQQTGPPGTWSSGEERWMWVR